MTAIKHTRRQLLATGSQWLAASALFTQPVASLALADSPLILSACTDRQGKHQLVGLQTDNTIRFKVPVADRAHAISCSNDRHLAIFFARRPGTVFYVVDTISGLLINTVNSQPGYHFYGHGVFSADGRYVYTTENHYHRQRGVIGIYDTQDQFKRVMEYNSGGIGPHQLAWLSDQTTLVIANGGILTHPDSGRKKLNLDTMSPALTYLHSSSGQIIDQFKPPHQHMSIRHLAVNQHDQVIVGIQYQGSAEQQAPLVLSHQGESRLQAMQTREYSWLALNQYIASVAVNNTGDQAITTSPRGNTVALWNLRTRQCLDMFTVPDVAGAGFSKRENLFVISSGSGQVLTLDTDTEPHRLQTIFSTRALQWDNHLTVI